MAVGADSLSVFAQVAVVPVVSDPCDAEAFVGSICTSGTAPCLAAIAAKPAWNGSNHPL